MNKQTNKQPKTWRAYMNSDWFAGFMSEVQHSSITTVASKLGIKRTTISQVFNGSGEYGKGTASTGNIERSYRGHYEKLSCPHTQAQVGINHCRELALRAACPEAFNDSVVYDLAGAGNAASLPAASAFSCK